MSALGKGAAKVSERMNAAREGSSQEVTEAAAQAGASAQSEGRAPVQVRAAPGIALGPAQLALLSQAFAKEKEILVKQEFRSGYSGALVVLVSVGAGRAPLVVKLAHPHDLEREFAAYEEHVRKVSPQNIAHLQGKPLVAADGHLGLLQYTFAGGESHLPTSSLHDYYETHGAEATSAVLNRIFRVYGRHWWANNRAQSYVLEEHYDRLLPVHFQAEPLDDSATASRLHDWGTRGEADDPERPPHDHTLIAGVSGAMASEHIEIGDVVHLKGLAVAKVREDGRTMTLVAAPPANEASAPRRIRVESPTPMPHRPGDVLESLLVRITATRITLLSAAAEAALPGFGGSLGAAADTFTVAAGDGRTFELPNPLCSLPEQLYKVTETKVSIIHGDLNLQNVLVDEPTGFSWLIDFAETRIGPTLLDLQRLEVQVITKLLPLQEEVSPEGVVEVMTRLHADPPLPPPESTALQEPYTVLATLRRLARQYLIDDMDWTEYYRGLVIALVGALKYDELDPRTRLLALVSAAAVDRLMNTPLGSENAMRFTAAAVADAKPKQGHRGKAEAPAQLPAARRNNRRRAGIGLIVAAVALIGLTVWQYALRPAGTGDAPPGVITPQGGATPVAAVTAAGWALGKPVVTATPVSVATGDAVADEPGHGESGPTPPATVSAVTDDGEADAPALQATRSEQETLVAEGATEEATPGPATEEAVGEPAQMAAGATRVNDTDGATYVFVPSGSFTMGSNSGESDEGPTHMVVLDPFWIMRTETTYAQYGRCVAAGACAPPRRDGWDDPELAEHPVTHVTWQEASDYADWAGGRLPTEAEWEKAARGTDQRAYPWGSEVPSNDLLNFNYALGATAPVGSYPEGASPFGALDMAGNVEEWVADRYDPEYYAQSPEQNPSGPEEGVFRAVRGGSYYSNSLDVRTFAREKALDTASFDSVGFRVLLPAE